MMKSAYRPSTVVKCLFAAILFVSVIYPLASLFWSAGDANFARIYASRSFTRALTNSVVLTTYATVIAIVLAWVAAWCVSRTRIAARRAFKLLLTAPMLIPSLSHGMGLIILLGANGVLTRILGLTTSVYGEIGIVLGSVMYAFPVAFLMICDIYRFEDASPIEAARVLGISAFRRFTGITLPFFLKPMINVIFAVFTLIVTDYGVALTVGGKVLTLPVLMYQETVGLLNFPKGCAVGIVLLIPAVIAFFTDRLVGAGKSSGKTHRAFSLIDRASVKGWAFIYCLALTVIIFLPIAAFAILSFTTKYPIDLSFTFAHIEEALQMRAGLYLVNSLLIAISVSFIGTYFVTVCAYFTARDKSRGTAFLHFVSMLTLAVPGIVLGLSYVLAFHATPFYATLAILISVNTVHFLGSPYLMAYNAFNKINPHLEGVAQTLSISRARLFKDVFLPLTRVTRLEIAYYFFVNSMVTISAVAFLASLDTKPVALMINQFEAQMMLEAAAFVSVAIFVANVLAKFGFNFLKKRASI